MADQLGDRIAKARRRCGLSGTALAERIGIAKQHLSAIETGRIPDPGVLLVEKIAEALNVNADYLLSGRLTPRRTFAELEEVA
jgi:transcriptional regulator with XRE-family HTH domain